MNHPQHILLVISAETQLERKWTEPLRNARQDPEVRVSVLYVIPRLPAAYLMLGSVADMEAEWYEKAKTVIFQVCRAFDIPESEGKIAQGSVREQAIKFAEKQGCDLIIGDVDLDLQAQKAQQNRGWFSFFPSMAEPALQPAYAQRDSAIQARVKVG